MHVVLTIGVFYYRRSSSKALDIGLYVFFLNFSLKDTTETIMTRVL